MKKKEENDIEFEETDEEGSAHTSAKKLQKLREDLQKCTKERQEYLTGWQRAKADLINERKNTDKHVLDVRSRAQEDVLKTLLPVLDSFDMAFANRDAWERVDANWRKGIEYIHANFLSVLSEYGILQFDGVGEVFDPTKHESIEMIPTEEEEKDHTVQEVLQKGYRQGATIIRPAKVKVAVYKKGE